MSLLHAMAHAAGLAWAWLHLLFLDRLAHMHQYAHFEARVARHAAWLDRFRRGIA